MIQKLRAPRCSPGVVYIPLDVIGGYSTSTLTSRSIFCLYAIALLEYTTVLLARRLSYVLDVEVGYLQCGAEL